MHLVLTYFHRIRGPEVYICFPDANLEAKTITKLTKFFDLDMDETFFEIVLINKKKKIVNLYFEIPSKFSRGNRELVMLSLIMRLEYDSRLTWSFLVDASHKILSTPDIYKAFYKHDDFREDDIEIDIYYEKIKTILNSSLSSLIERMGAKLEIQS